MLLAKFFSISLARIPILKLPGRVQLEFLAYVVLYLEYVTY